MPLFDGGGGIDQLNFHNVKTRPFQNWEAISLANSTELTFDGDLVLGDSGTGTGTLTVDDTSTVYAGSGGHAVRPFNSGALVEMVNAGRIDLTGTGAGDVFTVRGNYRGDGGGLYLRTVLGADNSSSDRLVIDGGTATGTTGIGVLTRQRRRHAGRWHPGGAGLEWWPHCAGRVLLFAPVAAGAYEYFLFRGQRTSENWYLRSTLVTGPTPPTAAALPRHRPDAAGRTAAITPAPPPPPEGATDPNLTAGEAPPPPPPEPAPVARQRPGGAGRAGGRRCVARYRHPPTPGARPAEGAVVPLYRVETAAYAVVPPLPRDLAGQPRYLPRAAGRTAPAVQPGHIPHRLGPVGGAEQRDPLEG